MKAKTVDGVFAFVAVAAIVAVFGVLLWVLDHGICVVTK